ncbi:hypothetical protein E5676_scaffold663G00170 [Cucumis melo var. makuwa]|uniref:Uncharacterized protein n=1 Tax=Cucumis melo var. makuwa TaxID=1194695 RepID=A0A5D3CUM2_CUCMM|nr:hypothetical protein E6C27_scaffold149G001670 [Cucumis melo var. makuwa]TYK14644.1 hypothetical protein E5676_scaffold663G00170 [Cucumis melo var. makuwa]
MTNLRCAGYTQYNNVYKLYDVVEPAQHSHRYTQYNNVYKLYDVVEPAQHSHRLCRSEARPALTTASLLRSILNVNNGI